MLRVSLEIARRQDTEPLFHRLLGSDEALFPQLQGDDCGWQAKRFYSVRLSWKAVLLKRDIGCCFNETIW